jgi:cytochrome c oxidase assembly factor CtaG
MENAGKEKEVNPYEMPVSHVSVKTLEFEHSDLVAKARKELARPATAIVIMSSTTSVFHSLPVINCIVGQVLYGRISINESTIAAYSLALFCLSLVECVGAVKMGMLQSLPLSYGAAILCLIPFVSPFVVLGVPFGIWILLLLKRPHIRLAFQLMKPQ